MTDCSQKMLSQTLKNLEQSHLVHREVYPEVPPRVEYSLTETGKSLMPALTALIAWGKVHFNEVVTDQHKHLLKPGDQCIGGGYYHFDFVSNRILLDRESYDFGRPKWHLLEILKVPSTYRGMRIVYSYDDGFHDDFNVSEELNIEYYD